MSTAVCCHLWAVLKVCRTTGNVGYCCSCLLVYYVNLCCGKDSTPLQRTSSLKAIKAFHCMHAFYLHFPLSTGLCEPGIFEIRFMLLGFWRNANKVHLLRLCWLKVSWISSCPYSLRFVHHNGCYTTAERQGEMCIPWLVGFLGAARCQKQSAAPQTSLWLIWSLADCLLYAWRTLTC